MPWRLTAPIAAGEGAGHLRDALLQPGEQDEHALQIVGDPGVVPQECPHDEVLAHGQAVEDAPALRHVADPQAHHGVGRAAGEQAILQMDPALPRRQQSGDRLERRGLARAVVAEERDDLAAAHLQRDVLEGADLSVVDVEAVKAQHWHSATPVGPGTPR